MLPISQDAARKAEARELVELYEARKKECETARVNEKVFENRLSEATNTIGLMVAALKKDMLSVTNEDLSRRMQSVIEFASTCKYTPAELEQFNTLLVELSDGIATELRGTLNG